jgi:hypothetical protein
VKHRCYNAGCEIDQIGAIGTTPGETDGRSQ